MIISIVNHKGGTGKTTTTVSLGSALANMGFRVLLIDIDAQGNLTYSLGLEEVEHTLAHVFMGECEFAQAICKAGNLDVVGANATLADVEISIANSKDRFHYLSEALLGTSGYDYILIDCPPSLSLLTTNALVASHGVIIPMQMEVLAVKGLEMMLQTISKVQATLNSELEVLGVLAMMVDSRKKLHTEIKEHIMENLEVKFFNQTIRASVKAAEAPSFGKSVVDYAPHSTTALDYLALASELVSNMQFVNQH